MLYIPLRLASFPDLRTYIQHLSVLLIRGGRAVHAPSLARAASGSSTPMSSFSALDAKLVRSHACAVARLASRGGMKRIHAGSRGVGSGHERRFLRK